MTILEKETIGPAWQRLTISVPEPSARPAPGQFFLFRCPDEIVCYLRRPIFSASIGSDSFTILLRPDPDPGLAWLWARRPDDPLDVIGPLGVGFPLPPNIRNLLLVSDTRFIGPLLGQMERALQSGISVTLVLGAGRAANLYPLAALPPAVEFQAATLDGSLGHQGPVTDLLPDLLPWADIVCAAGSTALYQTLKTQAEQIRLRAERGYLYGLITAYGLACGVGACLSCAIETEEGVKLACVEGPVFDLVTLVW